MYAKLYASVLNSSLWAEDAWTCKLFITMLVMADREGYIYGSPVGLARQACMTQEQANAALARLMAPDPNSTDMLRNPDNEGRRVEITESGWRVINYPYYRGFRDSDERRVQNREAKRRSRAKSAAVSGGQPESAADIECQHGQPSHPSDTDTAHTQIRDRKKKERVVFAPPTVAEVQEYAERKAPHLKGKFDPDEFVAFYRSKGWMVGKNPMLDWQAAVYTWINRIEKEGK